MGRETSCFACARGPRPASSAPPAALPCQASLGFPTGKSHQGPARSPAEELSASLETLLLSGLFSPPVHLRHSGGRKENPSENHNLITPICSCTASHFCLPGCLSPMLSSTLFSISCNHLLEISFSFKMSPWKGNPASWEWAETTTRKPVLQQPSSGRRASAPLVLIKPTQRVSFSGWVHLNVQLLDPARGWWCQQTEL